MAMENFQDRVVVVTGAASGIGWAICRRFADAGSIIAMIDMDETELALRHRELAETGARVSSHPCDVTEEGKTRTAVEQIIKTWGGIDVLVNNAGVTQRSTFTQTEISVYRKVMEINFFGALHCTKPAMESILNRKGQIVIIESIAGVSPLLGRSGYCASKHALHGFFTTVRSEVRHRGVHVMTVCPGFVQTNLQRRALGGDGSVTKRPQSAMGKFDTPEDVADAIFRAAQKRKPMLVLTTLGKLGYWFNRLAPVTYEKVMTRKFSAELER